MPSVSSFITYPYLLYSYFYVESLNVFDFLFICFFLRERRSCFFFFFFLNDPAPPEISPLPLPASLPIYKSPRIWNSQTPPLPRVKWSQRNNNNYEETGLLTSLQYFANNGKLFLKNFYLKSKRSIEKPKAEGPAAYVLTADDPRPGAQAELLRVLQLQGCEISRSTAPFTVAVKAKKKSGAPTPTPTPSAPAANANAQAAQQAIPEN